MNISAYLKPLSDWQDACQILEGQISQQKVANALELKKMQGSMYVFLDLSNTKESIDAQEQTNDRIYRSSAARTRILWNSVAAAFGFSVLACLVVSSLSLTGHISLDKIASYSLLCAAAIPIVGMVWSQYTKTIVLKELDLKEQPFKTDITNKRLQYKSKEEEIGNALRTLADHKTDEWMLRKDLEHLKTKGYMVIRDEIRNTMTEELAAYHEKLGDSNALLQQIARNITKTTLWQSDRVQETVKTCCSLLNRVAEQSQQQEQKIKLRQQIQEIGEPGICIRSLYPNVQEQVSAAFSLLSTENVNTSELIIACAKLKASYTEAINSYAGAIIDLGLLIGEIISYKEAFKQASSVKKTGDWFNLSNKNRQALVEQMDDWIEELNRAKEADTDQSKINTTECIRKKFDLLQKTYILKEQSSKKSKSGHMPRAHAPTSSINPVQHHGADELSILFPPSQEVNEDAAQAGGTRVDRVSQSPSHSGSRVLAEEESLGAHNEADVSQRSVAATLSSSASVSGEEDVGPEGEE